MMRIHLLSDLHNEFSPFAPEPLECDVVILAGDIVRISVNVTAHFANNVTGGFTRLRGV